MCSSHFPSLPLLCIPHHFTSLPRVNILSFSVQGEVFANDSTNATILTTRVSPCALCPLLTFFLWCCCLFEGVIKRIKKSLALPQWKQQRSVPSLNMHLFYSHFAIELYLSSSSPSPPLRLAAGFQINALSRPLSHFDKLKRQQSKAMAARQVNKVWAMSNEKIH